MPKRPSKKTHSRKTKQGKREQIKRSAAATPKPVSTVMSRLVSYFRLAANLARQHLAITRTIGACLVLGLAIWGVVAWLTAPEIGLEIGNRAPDFTLQTVDGESVSLRDFKGKTVILDFWQAETSLCPSSQNPLEDGSRLSRELQTVLNRWPDRKLAILAIAPLADSAQGKELGKKIGVTFPIAFDPSRKIYTDYDIAYDPTRVFIDKGGVIRAIMPGPALSTDEIDGILQSINKHQEIDSTRPIISTILISSITDKKAVIEFTTDKPAVGQVILNGPDLSSCTNPELITATNHTITLDSLQPNTTYQFRVLASHENKLESPYLSRKGSFTTLVDIFPPAISSVAVSEITDSSVTISWSTDELATSQLEYGATGSSNQMLKPEEKLATSHSKSMATLEADTTYQFTIKCKDPSGNEASTNGSFTTLSPSPSTEAVTVGNPAPNFTLPALDGWAVSLSDYGGKTVIVHFWSALCHACKSEMPLIQDFYTISRDDDVIILAISLGDSAETVKEFTISHNITLPMLLDPEWKLQVRYSPPPPYPTTYFIDSNGIIRNIKEGRFLSIDEIEEIMKSL